MGPIDPIDQGEPCTPGTTDQGSCLSPLEICNTWSPEGFMERISTCMVPCANDSECARFANNICANVGFTISEAGVPTSLKACVRHTVGEGETANVSTRHGTAMSGCPDPYQAYPWYIGSLLFQLEDDQVSCGLPCANDIECLVNRPNTTTPACNLGFLDSIAWPGVCSTRHAGKGARCSSQSVIEECELASGAQMICVNLSFNDADNVPDDREYGTCMEICDMMNPTCLTRADDAHMVSCEFGLFTNPQIGFCSDHCSAFPDDCGAPGSTPPLGGVARGMTCLEFNSTSPGMAVTQSLCADLAQTEMPFEAWDFMNMTMSCQDDAHRCPDRTTCTPIDQGSVCVYGCDSAVTPNGCQGTPFPQCAPINMTDTRGVCSP